MNPRDEPIATSRMSMQKIWTHQDISAPATEVWALLSRPEHWPTWGPSVRKAELDGERFELGATGTVTTALGPRVGFEITTYEEGSRWGWKVAGIAATDHTVEPLAAGSCKAGFGVPWAAAPYLVICQIALQRIKAIAEKTEVSL